MELNVDGTSVVEVSGNVALTLPPWMGCLSAAEAAQATGTDVVAAGRDPASGDVVIVTASGDVREIDVEASGMAGLGNGPVRPVEGGRTLRIELDELECFNIDSDWAVMRSTLLLSLSAMGHRNVVLFPTYGDEDHRR